MSVGALTMVLWLGWAAAPDPPNAEDRARARALFEQAVEARRQARWQDVRDLLEQSIARFPQFSTAWNLVTAHEQLDDLPAAEALLLQIRDGGFGPLDAAERAAAVERIATVSQALGTLQLEVGEAGAKVWVNGKSRGQVDADGRLQLRVPAGTLMVQVAARDGRQLERSVTIPRGESRPLRFTFVSESPRGRLIVELTDPTQSVVIDGVARGVGPLDLSLEPKRYQVALADDAEAQWVDVKAGHTQRVLLERDQSLWSRPWVWVVIGVAVSAAAATTVVLATRTSDPLPADFVAPPL